jgi:type II secretory pathway pseudopilin PulG
MIKKSCQSGFTLIEVIIYSLIFALFASSIVLFIFSALPVANNTRARIELANNARLVTQHIEEVIKQTQIVNAPSVGTGPTPLLSVDVASTSWNPIVYDVNQGVLEMSISNLPAVAVTSKAVSISSVSFEHFQFSTNSKSTIRFKATLNSTEIARPVSTSIDHFISIQ